MKYMLGGILVLMTVAASALAIYQTLQANELSYVLERKISDQRRNEIELQSFQRKLTECQRLTEEQIEISRVLREQLEKLRSR